MNRYLRFPIEMGNGIAVLRATARWPLCVNRSQSFDREDLDNGQGQRQRSRRQALQDEGVDTVFYLTGGPMVDVASRCIERFHSVDVRHEQAAAMAAHAYSRVSGKPGVCFAASGPGVTNLITGVGNAFLDAVPVVALGGASAVSQTGMGAFQEMDQVGMFKPITKYAERVIDVRRIPEIINKAFRVATSGQPGPVYVDLPGDVLYNRVDESEVMFPGKPHSVPRVSGDPALIKQAIAMLKQAQRPIILTGTGVFWSGAMEELKEFVDLTRHPLLHHAAGPRRDPRGSSAELSRRAQSGLEGGRRGADCRHAPQLYRRLRPAAALGHRA